jgi:hypothetical protein
MAKNNDDKIPPSRDQSQEETYHRRNHTLLQVSLKHIFINPHMCSFIGVPNSNENLEVYRNEMHNAYTYIVEE